MNIIEKLGITEGARLRIVTDDSNNIRCRDCAAEMLEALINPCVSREYQVSYYGRANGWIEYLYNEYKPIIEKATGKTWEEIKEIIS